MYLFAFKPFLFCSIFYIWYVSENKRSYILTLVTILWDMTPCRPVDSYRLEESAAFMFRVIICEAIWNYIPEDCSFCAHCCEECHIFVMFFMYSKTGGNFCMETVEYEWHKLFFLTGLLSWLPNLYSSPSIIRMINL